jgi:hypothetical protein
MVIYLFRDKSNDEFFAFSTDVTGRNIPRAAANTEWMFIEALNTLKFPEPVGHRRLPVRAGPPARRWLLPVSRRVH